MFHLFIKPLDTLLHEPVIRLNPIDLEGVNAINCFAGLGIIVVREYEAHPHRYRWRRIYPVPLSQWFHSVARAHLEADVKVYLFNIDTRSVIRQLWRLTRFLYEKRGLRGELLSRRVAQAVYDFGLERLDRDDIDYEIIDERVAVQQATTHARAETLRELRATMLQARMMAEMREQEGADSGPGEFEEDWVDIQVSEFTIVCEGTGEVCPICQETMEEDVVRVEACGHCFCEECLEGWVVGGVVGANRKCPLCRTDLVPREE